MKATDKIEIINMIVAVLLMMLFAYAAASKLHEQDKFIAQMKLAPVPLMHLAAAPLAWLLPLLEMLIVVLLVVERWRMKGLLASLALLTAFQIYILAMIASGLPLPCTCGGLISGLKWEAHLFFNAFFMVIAIVSITLNIRRNEVAIDYKQPFI